MKEKITRPLTEGATRDTVKSFSKKNDLSKSLRPVSGPPRMKNRLSDRESYERDLAIKQENHLRQIQEKNWMPCAHDECPKCHGTGKKINGEICIHHLSCMCPKCTLRCGG